MPGHERRKSRQCDTSDRLAVDIASLLLDVQPGRLDAILSETLALIGVRGGLVQAVLDRPGQQPLTWHDRVDPVSVDLPPLLLTDTGSEEAPELLHRNGIPVGLRMTLEHGSVRLGTLLLAYGATSSRSRRSRVAFFEPAAEMLSKALQRERKAEEWRPQEERLQQAQRLETAGLLASGLAHNLNNIVGAMIGHTELAEGCLVRGALPTEHILEIRRACERAEEMVESLLDIGRHRVLQQVVDISRLTSETLSMFQASPLLPCTVVVLDEADGARVFGRSGELQQVLLNLLRNAAQAGAQSISLKLVQTALHKQHVLPLASLPPGDYIRIDVTDDGCGMDEQTVARIFEPFFTTRSIGTGLGLATVIGIIKEHGGGINVRSAPGAGSVFEVWLANSSGASPQAPVRRGNGELIVITGSSNQEHMLHLEDVIAALGYEPLGCMTQADALRAVTDGCDAIIVDARDAASKETLPFVNTLRRSAAELPLVVLLDDAYMAQRERARSDGLTSVVVQAEAGYLGASLSQLFAAARAANHTVNLNST